MNDLHTLQRALGATYRVDRELGGGGMSRVFVARDLTLDRDVVVKLLDPGSTHGISGERFRREIQLIARLQHPHVVPLLSAGDADGALFYVMPFIGGETLRARLVRDGPLSVADATRFLRELLDALAFAHTHGVIHRDIKPENVLIEAGHAVLADFGVSKALRESGSLTSAGISLGTPAYMAPEQASGDPAADHRADLYSVGVLGYELLTGELPFTGSAQQMIVAHLTTPAAPLKSRRSDVPDALAAVLMKALEKEPDARPQSASGMLAEVEASAAVTSGVSQSTLAHPRARGSRRWLGVTLAAAAVVTAAGWWMLRPHVLKSAQSMAIMPFAVADGDTTLVRLGQNLVTTVGANLDGVGSIHTADAIAVLSHARRKGPLLSLADASEIGKNVGASSVVYGTLVRDGADVRADAVLYDVSAPSTPLVRVSATVPADSLVALTDSLTWHLLREIWSRGNAPTPAYSSVTTKSNTALREFLEGERLFARTDIAGASEAYHRAIAADSTFWFAYYRNRLARGWISLPADTELNATLLQHAAELPPRERELVLISTSATLSERVRRSKALAERYPTYAPAVEAYADVLIHHAIRLGFDVRDAIRPWQDVVRLMPGDYEAANHLVWACAQGGDFPCARTAVAHFDSLVSSDSAPRGQRAMARYMSIVLNPPGPRTRDSLLKVSRADSVNVPPFVITTFAGSAIAANPGLPVFLDSVLADESKALPEATRARAEPALRMLRSERGDWTAVMQLRDQPSVNDIATLRGFILAEAQGAMPPNAKTAQLAAAFAARSSTSAAGRDEAEWISAVNALLRGDTSSVRRQLVAFSRDTSRRARFAARSLRGLMTGVDGNHAAAAESLLVLERAHGDSTFKLYAAFGVDRIMAAQWLTESKQYAAADSLLSFTMGGGIGVAGNVAATLFAHATLQRSRIAEALGRRDDAVRFASVFANLYDLAQPSERPLVVEARQRMERLGAKLDAPKSFVKP